MPVCAGTDEPQSWRNGNEMKLELEIADMKICYWDRESVLALYGSRDTEYYSHGYMTIENTATRESASIYVKPLEATSIVALAMYGDSDDALAKILYEYATDPVAHLPTNLRPIP